LVLATVGNVPASGQEKEKQAWIVPSTLVVPAVRSVTACLIRHRFLHPDKGFPRTLAEIRADSNCDQDALTPGRIKDYWFFYEPIEGVGGKVTDFHLLAMPAEAPRPNSRSYDDPVMSDGRGIVFTYNLWSGRKAAGN